MPIDMSPEQRSDFEQGLTRNREVGDLQRRIAEANDLLAKGEALRQEYVQRFAELTGRLAEAEAQLAEERAKYARLVDRCRRDDQEIQQTLGRALGYPKYSDHQEVFPGAVEADGVCVGEHVGVTLATEAARTLAEERKVFNLHQDPETGNWVAEIGGIISSASGGPAEALQATLSAVSLTLEYQRGQCKLLAEEREKRRKAVEALKTAQLFLSHRFSADFPHSEHFCPLCKVRAALSEAAQEGER